MARNDVRFRNMRQPVLTANTEDASLSFEGCVCRPNASGNLVAAQADTVAHAKATQYVYSGQAYKAHPLGMGPVRVALVSGLNSGTAPAINQIVYLSAATAGKATNVEPSGGTNQSVKLGYIQDLGDGYDNTNGSLATIMSVQMGTPGADGDADAYTPGDAGDWSPAPTTIAGALDQLAARLAAIE